ncbi:hypothetical protein [Streptomyces yerevanensis]|uniref:hypothetical protein n=1 Tax=Streptomyces yerevanensis TaxID=66378 RepID=UPI0005267EB9|nr:hypothetical protein [Streptomyces yerevanensis]
MIRGFRRRDEPGGTPKSKPPLSSGDRAAQNGQEFEALLQKAERLLASVRRGGRRQLTLRCLQAAVVLVPALVLLVTDARRAALVAVLMAAGVLCAVAELWAIRPVVRTRERQLAELNEMVDTLREVLVHLANRERWPAHRVRDARDRLAQFSVEERGGLW